MGLKGEFPLSEALGWLCWVSSESINPPDVVWYFISVICALQHSLFHISLLKSAQKSKFPLVSICFRLQIYHSIFLVSSVFFALCIAAFWCYLGQTGVIISLFASSFTKKSEYSIVWAFKLILYCAWWVSQHNWWCTVSYQGHWWTISSISSLFCLIIGQKKSENSTVWAFKLILHCSWWVSQHN